MFDILWMCTVSTLFQSRIFNHPEDDSEIESKHCTSSRISSVKLLQESRSRRMDRTSMLFPVDSTAQLVEQRSGNTKMWVRIPLYSAFLVDFSSVGQFMKYSVHGTLRITMLSYHFFYRTLHFPWFSSASAQLSLVNTQQAVDNAISRILTLMVPLWSLCNMRLFCFLLSGTWITWVVFSKDILWYSFQHFFWEDSK